MRSTLSLCRTWFALVAAAASLLGVAVRAPAQCVVTEDVLIPVLPAVTMTAYDAARGRTTVMNWGFEGAVTWGWNGSIWTRLAQSGPTERRDAVMTFDAARGVIVLFGGNDFFEDLADTWEFNGTGWTRRMVSGPPARRLQAMTYDAARQKVVLFGGLAGDTPLSDTWEYDGVSWTKRATDGVTPNSRSTLVYDPVRQVSVMIGGDAADPTTHEWDGSAWTTPDVPGIDGTVSLSGGVFDPVSGRVIVVVGGGAASGTWAYDGKAWTQVDTQDFRPGQSQGTFGRVMYDTARSRLMVMADSAIWERQGGPWTLAYFRPSTGGEYAYDTARRVIVSIRNYADARSTWEHDDVRPSLKAGFTPSYDSGAMAYDPIGARAVLVHAASASGPAMTWSWSGAAWQQVAANTQPCEDGFAPMGFGFDSQAGVLVGVFCDGVQVRVWSLDGGTWTRLDDGAPGGPPGRTSTHWAYDARRGVWVLYGGRIASGFDVDDLWEWDSATWTPRPLPGGPGPRQSAAFWFDPGAGVVMLASGFHRISQGAVVSTLDAWTYDGVEWRSRGITSRTAGSSDVYQPDADALFQDGVSTIRAARRLRFSHPVLKAHPADAQLLPGARLELSVAVAPGSSTTTRWRRDGVQLINGGPISGATTTTLVIDPVGVGDSGQYEAVVNNSCGLAVSSRALVAVMCGPADWSGDGVVNSTDVSDFINDWFEDQVMGTLLTDFDRNGVVNSTDVSDFINVWFEAPEACR